MQKSHRVYYDEARASWLVFRLAFPLPIIVIAELFGVPSSDREQFRRWSSDYVGSDYALRLATAKKIAFYFHGLIEQRRREPCEDLISEFLRAEVDGEHLPITWDR